MNKKELNAELKKAIINPGRNKTRIIELLNMGANPDVTHPETKVSILFSLMPTYDETLTDEDLFAEFINHGADVNKRNKSGTSLLSMACLYGLYPSAKILLEAGAKVDTDKDPAFVFLCVRNPWWSFYLGSDEEEVPTRLEIAKLLIKKADINRFDNQGRFSPLMLAAEHGWYDIVHFLVEHGADVNARNKAGDTAIMFACGEVKTAEYDCKAYWWPKEAHYPIVKFLIENSADIAITNNQKRSALSIAMNSKQFKTACMLAENLSRRNLLTCEMKNKFKGTEYYEKIKNLADIGSGYIKKTDSQVAQDRINSWIKARHKVQDDQKRLKNLFDLGIDQRYGKHCYAWWLENLYLCIGSQKSSASKKPIVSLMELSADSFTILYEIKGKIIKEVEFGRDDEFEKVYQVLTEYLSQLLIEEKD